MLSSRWLLLGLALMTLPTGCVSRGSYNEKVDELYKVQSELKRLRELSEDYDGQLTSVRDRASSLESENGQLRTNWEQANRELEAMRAKLNSAPSVIEGVDQRNIPGGVAFSIQDHVLFDSGRAELKSSAKTAINKLADLLKADNYRIEVAGHTDTDPVQKTKGTFKRGNIELGAARALSVFDALRGAGVSENRMSVASYGEFEPLDPADKSKNRRVEVRVYSGS